MRVVPVETKTSRAAAILRVLVKICVNLQVSNLRHLLNLSSQSDTPSYPSKH